jgi:hypothetical protein
VFESRLEEEESVVPDASSLAVAAEQGSVSQREKCDLQDAVTAKVVAWGPVPVRSMELISRLAVETNRRDSPMLGVHRVSSASISAPFVDGGSVSRGGGLFSRKGRLDISSPDPRRTDFEASSTFAQ